MKPVNKVEAPKTASTAVPEASLGEDNPPSRGDNPPQGEDKYFLPYSSTEGVLLTNLIIDAFKKFIQKKDKNLKKIYFLGKVVYTIVSLSVLWMPKQAEKGIKLERI